MLLDLLPYARSVEAREGGTRKELWCQVRRTWLVATPEEFVRQGLIALLRSRGYPLAWMQVERAVGRTGDRLDLLVLDRRGSPFVLAEAKAPGHSLRPAILQLARYNRHWRAPFVLAVNGQEARLCELDFEDERLCERTALPSYPD